MKKVFTLLLLSILSCKALKPKEWTTMDLGGSRVTVPVGSELKKEKNIDSYVAK